MNYTGKMLRVNTVRNTIVRKKTTKECHLACQGQNKLQRTLPKKRVEECSKQEWVVEEPRIKQKETRHV